MAKRQHKHKKRAPGRIDWDAQPLGEEPDEVIAARLNVRKAAVGNARRARGIYLERTLVDWDEQPFGQLPDRDLAAQLGAATGTVCHHRNRRGIPPYQPPSDVDWDTQLLGEFSDREIARRLKET